MPFEIVRNDITKMAVDAIVNTANPQPVIGAGTDGMIHAAAGPRLLKARQKIGAIEVGCAAVTDAYGLRAKYVIHTVGPVWQDGKHNVDRKHFSKIRNNPAYQPSKSTALPFAVALELNLDETKDFIGRAGYALSHSSKADIIVEYFIQRKKYDIFTINETLFAFREPLLGC